MATDYYQVLGVPRDATGEEIKRAYRKLARELHPDLNPDPQTQERFKDVTAAYEILSDPSKRQMYDMGADPNNPSAGAGGFGAGFNFNDIMDAFFTSGGGGGARRGPRPRVRRGQDALIRLEVDLREAAFGAVRDITVDTAIGCDTCTGSGSAPGSERITCTMCQGRGEVQTVQRSFLGQVMTARPCPQCSGYGDIVTTPCADCAGEGRVRTRRTLSVQIPPGVETGTRIQLTGEGEVGPGNGPAGDIYVEILEKSDPVFERHGDDLHCTITIPMTAAALGTTIPLQTLDAVEQIDIKPGTQSGNTRTIRGQGVTHLRASGRGDLHVHITVATPTRLDDEQQQLLRQLAELRGEDQPAHQVKVGEDAGFFSRLRDAFR